MHAYILYEWMPYDHTFVRLMTYDGSVSYSPLISLQLSGAEDTLPIMDAIQNQPSYAIRIAINGDEDHSK